MIKAGITGNIGSGKSTVCKVFQLLDVPVYLADDRAKTLMHESSELASKIRSLFGEDIYENGQLQRKKLASTVFSDSDKLKQLNSLVHPAVAKDFEKWTVEMSQHPLVIKEAALLFESGSYKTLDYIITVTAPEETRIERIIKRDNTTREEVKNRIKNQWPEQEKINKSQAVINNDGNELLISQVIQLKESLLANHEKSNTSA